MRKAFATGTIAAAMLLGAFGTTAIANAQPPTPPPGEPTLLLCQLRSLGQCQQDPKDGLYYPQVANAPRPG